MQIRALWFLALCMYKCTCHPCQSNSIGLSLFTAAKAWDSMIFFLYRQNIYRQLCSILSLLKFLSLNLRVVCTQEVPRHTSLVFLFSVMFKYDKGWLEAVWLLWYHGQIPWYLSAFVCTRGRNDSKCTIDTILRLIFSVT